jgi:AAHS family 4-hydroxybenzoate transporter-like MFS transporter
LTLLTAQVSSVPPLTIVRFIAGIGLGCIIPNATALIGEYSPRRLRITFMACISVGFTAGGALAGFVSAWLIPAFDWRAVFLVNLPLGLAAGLVAANALRGVGGRREAKLDIAGASPTGWAHDPTVAVGPNVEFVVNEENKSGVPALHLFREGRGATTLLLWVINFMNIYNLYLLSGWLPTIAGQLGYSAQTSVLSARRCRWAARSAPSG